MNIFSNICNQRNSWYGGFVAECQKREAIFIRPIESPVVKIFNSKPHRVSRFWIQVPQSVIVFVINLCRLEAILFPFIIVLLIKTIGRILKSSSNKIHQISKNESILPLETAMNAA